MSVSSFAYSASHRVMAGLAQEVGLRPGLNYRPTGYNSARVVLLKLTDINPHYLGQIQALQKQLTMWAGLDDKTSVRIGWQGTNILIEIPKPPPYWAQVTIESMEARRMIRRGPIATLGLGLQDDPKRINFKEEAMAHVFITGQTRSGKTNAQRLIAWNLAHNTTPDEARIIIFDVAKSGYKWRDFNGLAHLAHPVVVDVPEADAVLSWLNREIARRAGTGQTSPRLFILIDELKALADDSGVAANYLARIASVGGEFGIHLILATQYPQIKMLGSAELKRNVTTRLCGKVDDANAAANALGLPSSGAESLQGYGDFLLRDFNGLSRMTVAKIEAGHVAKLDRGAGQTLDLSGVDVGNAPDVAPSAAESYHPEHVAMALFRPTGVNAMARAIREDSGSCSNERAARIRRFAGLMWAWAEQNGIRCLPDSHPDSGG